MLCSYYTVVIGVVKPNLDLLEKLSQVSQSLDSIADCFAELLVVAWVVVCHDLVAEFADESEDE